MLLVTHHLELKVELQQYLFLQLFHLLEVEVVEVTLIHPFLQTNVEKMEDQVVEVLLQVMEVQEILLLQVQHKELTVVMELVMVFMALVLVEEVVVELPLQVQMLVLDQFQMQVMEVQVHLIQF